MVSWQMPDSEGFEEEAEERAKNTKPIIKNEKCESFFNFFSPPVLPDDEDDIDEDQAEELQSLMEQDYDIGSTIRDKIIPHAVSWFTGEADKDDELGIDDEDEDVIDEEDEEDEEDDNEDEDDDEDEDDEDEKEVKPRKKKGGRAQAGEGQQGERPPECKQQ